SMPNLCGLSESEAISRIRSLGFEVGEIKYAPSSSSAGTVTEQSVAPYTSLELGASVSITVSSGDSHTQRLVPDLYGLTLDEAVSRLGECGLVLGNVYYIGSTAPDDISARVVSQSPESSSAISSSAMGVPAKKLSKKSSWTRASFSSNSAFVWLS
ncbi:MAG: PASTA domain-containing protein, partial [Clostridia bacterium]|nr:PASTA domain-containing protein [Clostridia bacterium]